MKYLTLALLVASAACGPFVTRPKYCKSFPFQPHVAILSSVSPNGGSSGSGVGLTNCQTLEPVYVPTSDGDARGIYNRAIAQKVRNLDASDARSLGMRRFLVVEVETDCGGACHPDRFSYQYECGPGPALTSLRVLDGTKEYPLHLDDVVDEAERRHKAFLAVHEAELRALVSTRPSDVRQETTMCVSPTDTNLVISIRSVARIVIDCRGHTDCGMMPPMDPTAALSSDYTVSRDGHILDVRTSGPTRSP